MDNGIFDDIFEEMTTSNYSTTDFDIEPGVIAWHVFIQWLAYKKLLVLWMDYIIDKEDKGKQFNFFHKNIIAFPLGERLRLGISNHNCFEFLNYNLCGPGWAFASHGWSDGELLHREWSRVSKKLTRLMEVEYEFGEPDPL